jgi:hypothetical protein
MPTNDAFGNKNPRLQALPGGKRETDDKPPSVLRSTAERVAIPLALLLTVGTLAYNAARNHDTSTPVTAGKGPATEATFDAQLRGLPQRQETIPEGGGALDAVRAADPNTYAHNSALTQTLVHYVNGEAPNHDANNPILQSGERVQVPVLPGEPQPKSPK